ncbi:ABC transporter A family member 7-like isoform X1 [Vigna umbellata]|uniref:ABC transporter A family member 7-like isoform X1 n=1 Tax=Vigna umbellata TaxID=87088 RepID=UPI001F5F616E|nr:ABC transporter A family member 7-like isoform X1 [Vigna umbellata]
MANSTSASFFTQAKALLLKNITFQKRNVKTNVRLILFPAVLCVLLFVLQLLFDTQLDKSKFKCGCVCADNRTQISQCPNSEKRCGVQYSDFFQAAMCPIPNPVEWPPLLQLPAPPNRAVRTGFLPFFDLPDASCRRTDSCPLSLLFTGENHSFALSVSEKMFRSTLSISDFGSNFLAGLAVNVLGSESKPERNNFIEPAFSSNLPIYYLQTNCTGTENSGFSFPSPTGENNEIKCALAKNLWRNSSTDINSELYKGYQRGNSEGQINEIVSAFDFLNSNGNRYNVGIWYNSTYHQDTEYTANALLRVPRSVNLISNSYLQFLLGPGTKIIFEFVKEMPKPETIFRLDISSIVGPLFFTWVILQLFPVILTSLVYEKQQKLRIMMKMHGLGDRPYWMISYGYFLVTSVIYMLCFVIFGSLLGKNITIEFISLRIYPFSLMLLTLFSGLKIFTANDYSIQFVFYFIYINLQIALAFLVATMFSNVKTATVTAYIGVFGTGLLGGFLFKFFVQNISFPRGWIILMELYPGFALYRGLYELAQFSVQGNTRGTDGMKWHNLSESTNGMKAVLIIMFAEWIVMLFAAFYIDQVLTLGSRKGPLFLLKGFQKKSPFQKLDTQMQVSKELSQMEKPDVIQEKEKVEELLLEPTINHAILCDDLRKVYPGRDGNPDKFAVRGLFLSVPPGECFGMLGPNGAGKTSFINMMIGLTKPTSGTAFVQGLDIRTQMGGIYTTMGVCPQHDLLWDNLTGREHLLFYGRLKNLRGSVLKQAVEDSLKDLNLFHGGVADKQVGKYSGGMKRRLSVAISLIGDPKIVYMDEPSSGLDPASRKRLWSVVKHAKQNRAIILTTHSMEEAEALCDRLGIFVNGSLQCVGNAKELKARYGGTYVLTVTTSSEHEKDVENMVQKLTPNANKIYHLSGTQKFELPKEDVRISDVFQAVDVAKRKFTVSAWGLVDTTLEDVFIKVAREAQAFDTLS